MFTSIYPLVLNPQLVLMYVMQLQITNLQQPTSLVDVILLIQNQHPTLISTTHGPAVNSNEVMEELHCIADIISTARPVENPHMHPLHTTQQTFQSQYSKPCPMPY